VLQHGYAHRNYAGANERKAEYGPHRPLAEMCGEIVQGRRRLAAQLGPAFVPVFVPPWNRIDPRLRALLPGLGFSGLSAFGARSAANEANVHCDLMLWRPTRRFRGEEGVLAQIVSHLAARREAGWSDEATGIMTHHLAQNEQTWLFLERLVSEVSTCDGAHWLTVDELFRLPR
jgi:hypothetical protein